MKDDQKQPAISRQLATPEALLALRWVALTLGLALCLELYPFHLDDAFITYRYAQHLLLDAGFTFNVGASATEGFSSPIWMFCATAIGWLAGAENIHWTGPILGLLSYLVMGLLPACRAAVTLPRSEAAMAAVLLWTIPSAVYYAATGLETVFFAAICMLVTLCVAPGEHRDQPRTSLIILCSAAAIAGWTRPEAPWLLVILGLAWFWSQHSPAHRRMIVAAGAALIVSLIALLLWRQIIFSDWLPNTYYAKSAQSGTALDYIASAVTSWWFAPWLVLGGLGAATGAPRHRFYASAAISWMLAVYLEGGDWMPLGRFLLPGQALLALAACGLLHRLKVADTNKSLALALLITLALGWANYQVLERETRATDAALVSVKREAEEVRLWLMDANIQHLALVDIGAYGYYGGFDIFDLAGLTDREIGRRPGGLLEKIVIGQDLHRRGVDGVILRLGHMPQLVAGEYASGLRNNDFYSITEATLFSDPEFKRRYALERLYLPSYARRPIAGLAVFFRRDAEQAIGNSGEPEIPLVLLRRPDYF